MTTITTKHALLLTALADFGAQFDVVAGKYDGSEENCKYSDRFATYDEALIAFDKVGDYPWRRIEVVHAELLEARMAKLRASAAAVHPDPAYFEQYGAYVDACRAHARATRQRVVSYVSANAWRAARSVAA